jgi:hypothetical protein
VVIFLAGERAIDIGAIALLKPGFVIGFGKIDRTLGDDRGRGIEEGKALFADQTPQRIPKEPRW